MSDPIDPNNSANSIVLPISYTPGGYITFTYNGATWAYGNSNEASSAPEEKKPENKGCLCKKCNDFNEYAEPN